MDVGCCHLHLNFDCFGKFMKLYIYNLGSVICAACLFQARNVVAKRPLGKLVARWVTRNCSFHRQGIQENPSNLLKIHTKSGYSYIGR